MLVIADEGSPFLLTGTLGKADLSADQWKVVLFSNNLTPIPANVLADFTAATFSGGGPTDIDSSLWGSPSVSSHVSSSTYNPGVPIIWVNGGSAQTVYGYVVYDDDSGLALFSERFGASRTLNMGDSLELTLIFTGQTLP